MSSASPEPLAASRVSLLWRKASLFALWFTVVALFFAIPLQHFVSYSLSNDNASHAILIPAISVWLVYLERERIFKQIGSDPLLASALAAVAAGVAALAFLPGRGWTELNRLSAYVFALLLFWLSGFALCFGRAAMKQARFALLFLFLTIPIPDFLLERAIYALQKGTTEIAALLFDWSGAPVLRDGFVFHLAHANIEIAKECSGIRSSLALLILAILVAHFSLRTFWKQMVLVIAGLFVMILKNGIRVVALTLLATYVDPGFLFGRLHREGGVVFFLLGLALLAPLLWLLERSEKKAIPSAHTPR